MISLECRPSEWILCVILNLLKNWLTKNAGESLKFALQTLALLPCAELYSWAPHLAEGPARAADILALSLPLAAMELKGSSIGLICGPEDT